MPEDASFWQPLALVLLGGFGTGVPLMLRGDFLGRRAAAEAERRLAVEIEQSERRTNERIDREMVVIGRELREIKDAIVRLENRRAN